ncbi:hypothetical protein [Priestia endophytica]|uniref:hypothetical protein n=1 Tax=Priestia endophytica TaxID=135735 RepID=UPI002282ACF6|nr:hypothetical protein [Priestia endophytica]MCY8234625.1 hypothetical protein [Priestia endophytica]
MGKNPSLIFSRTVGIWSGALSKVPHSNQPYSERVLYIRASYESVSSYVEDSTKFIEVIVLHHFQVNRMVPDLVPVFWKR